MKRSDFKEGDVVRLKSGGKLMTAEPLMRTDDVVACVWFEGTTLHRDAFHPDALEIVPPTDAMDIVRAMCR